MPGNDILVLKENTQGHDFIIGDLHGSLSLLKEVLSKLKPEDRLLIAGDLTDDREVSMEEDVSMAVINTILEHNKRDGNIYAIKGNHEQMCLDYGAPPAKKTKIQTMIHYLSQGGGWFLEQSMLDQRKVLEFFKSLPAIVHIQGKYPFHVVHADMPFNDDELMEKIKRDDLSLSPTQYHHAIWARPHNHKGPGDPIFDELRIPGGGSRKIGRTKTSIPCYCGHNINGGVRINSNTIVLDLGAYSTKVLIAVNHTELTSSVYNVSQQSPDMEQQESLDTSKNIQAHLALMLTQRKKMDEKQRPADQKQKLKVSPANFFIPSSPPRSREEIMSELQAVMPKAEKLERTIESLTKQNLVGAADIQVLKFELENFRIKVRYLLKELKQAAVAPEPLNSPPLVPLMLM